jgi:hypothetical protein
MKIRGRDALSLKELAEFSGQRRGRRRKGLHKGKESTQDAEVAEKMLKSARV